VRTSMVLIMEPVFSVLFGIIILSEHLTWRGWLGCALILAGMLMTEIPTAGGRKKLRPPVKSTAEDRLRTQECEQWPPTRSHGGDREE